MLTKLLFYFSIIFHSVLVTAGQIAISFDDAPQGSTRYFTGTQRTNLLIESLKEAGVNQAIFFVTTRGLNTPDGQARIEAYSNAGHLIANHSHSHGRPDEMGVDAYIADIKLAHSKIHRFQNFTPMYRFPYLNYGKSIDLRDRIRIALGELGYSNGYVTVDNADWYMDSSLQKALLKGKKINLERLKLAYIEALWDSIEFYDQLAKDVLGRSPKHILLLHENDLAALFIKDLVEYIRAKNWEIISPIDAYSDPISKLVPETLVNSNGKISAIAHAKGYAGIKLDRYQNKNEIDKLFMLRKVFE